MNDRAAESEPGPSRQLYAGWRRRYVAGVSDAEVEGEMPTACVLCRVIDTEPDRILAVGAVTVAILNRYPYVNGHLMVLPRRHVADLAGMNELEHDELWTVVREATVAVQSAYHPGGINVGANVGAAAGAGIPDHLHVHVLPRWRGDTNFMTTIGDVRVIPEDPDESVRRLRAAWPERGQAVPPR